MQLKSVQWRVFGKNGLRMPPYLRNDLSIVSSTIHPIFKAIMSLMLYRVGTLVSAVVQERGFIETTFPVSIANRS